MKLLEGYVELGVVHLITTRVVLQKQMMFTVSFKKIC